MRERMMRDANHDTMMSILHEKVLMGEGDACYDDAPYDQDHDKIMSMLHRRIATGEGDEYGGWAKGTELKKAQYSKIMKKKGYTKEQIYDLWKKLKAKRRKEMAPVPAKRAPAKRASKKSGNSWIQFSKEMSKKHPGLTKAQLSDMYWQTKGSVRPSSKYNVKSVEIAYENYVKPLDKAIEILEQVIDTEGKLPRNIYDSIKTINQVKDKTINEIKQIATQVKDKTIDEIKQITTQYKRTGPRSHLPLPPGKIRQILQLEQGKLDNPENADLIDLSIKNILASGEGDLLHDYY